MSALAPISSALPPGADLPGGVAEGPFLTQSGHSALLTNVVADDAAGEAGRDRSQSCPPWPVRHVPIGRSRRARELDLGNPAADR